MTSPVHKNSSQSLLQGTKGLWSHYDSPKDTFQPGIIAQIQKTKSMVERMLLTKEKGERNSILDMQQFRTKQLLVDTQERIFKEVIKLIEEVEQTKKEIIEAWEDNRKIQVSHPEAIQMAHFHGYSQKLTLQQCTDLEQENLQLSKQIAELESQKLPNLTEVLKLEKQKYEDLKSGLLQSKSSAGPLQIPQPRLNELKLLISEHQQKRKESLRSNYPDLDRIKQQNEQLRLKTIQNLKRQQFQQQLALELASMRNFLQNEEAHRQKFMEELKIFKAEFKRIKNQNQIFREKLVAKQKIGSKENIKLNSDYRDRPTSKPKVIDRPNSKPRFDETPYTNPRTVQRTSSRPRLTQRSSSRMKPIQTYHTINNNVSSKLNEYESLIQRMQGRYY